MIGNSTGSRVVGVCDDREREHMAVVVGKDVRLKGR